jgi:hypothetical protein
LDEWAKVRNLRSQSVFSNGQGGYLDVREAWKSAAVKAGFPGMRFHDPRHVVAAFLDQAGCTPRRLPASWVIAALPWLPVTPSCARRLRMNTLPALCTLQKASLAASSPS